MNLRSHKWYLQLFLPVCFCVACIVGPGCRRAESPPSDNASTSTIRIGIQDNVASAPVILATQRDFFKRFGIKAELVPFPSGKLAYEALLAGEVEFCTVSEIPVLTHGPDVPAKVISCIAESRNGAWITARKDRGISTPVDLKGKTIGTQKKSAVHFFLNTFLKEHNLDDRTCNIVFYSADELPGALAAGEIDAFSMRNPFSAQAKALIGDDQIVEFESSLYLQHFLLVASQKLLEQTPHVAKKVLKAVIMAEAELSDPVQQAPLFSKRYPSIQFSELQTSLDAFIYKIRLDDALLVTWSYETQWWKTQGIDVEPDIDRILDASQLRSVDPLRIKLRK